MKRFSLLAALALAALASPASAEYAVYGPQCAIPAPAARVWYINPGAATVNGDGLAIGAGSTPDAAHGGEAVGGVMGTADGSAAHPFNSLQAVFASGHAFGAAIPGYTVPLYVGTGYNHGGMNGGFGVGVGAHGSVVDTDWTPTGTPNPNRIQPGDEIRLETATYGKVNVGLYGLQNGAVDASGKTLFLTIKADSGAKPVFAQLNIQGSRGYAFDGTDVKSDLTIANVAGKPQISINGSSLAPTKDIIVNNSYFRTWDSFDEVYAAWNAADPTHATYPLYQNYMKAVMGWGIAISGDDQPGVDNACIAITNSHDYLTYTGVKVVNSGQVLINSNEFDHFGADAIDIASWNMTANYNFIHDPIDVLDAVHPDAHQTQISSPYPGPFYNVVVDHERAIELLDPSNPTPGAMTFLQSNGKLINARITNNIGVLSGCNAIFYYGDGSLIANNTVVSNGINSGPGCRTVQIGVVPGETGSHNNIIQNNVVAGRFTRYCASPQTDVWRGNVQIPGRVGGVVLRDPMTYCAPGATSQSWPSAAGVYDGVTIYTDDSPSFAFQHYDPPANSMGTLSDPDLTPTPGGPLAGTGIPLTFPNIGAK